MASQLYTYAFNISAVENRSLCINGTPWIWHLLEECVENAWEYCSVVIGLISIVCFLFAALPQIHVAWRDGKVDQALSLGFLLCWIAGDLTNLIGCYLTNQLPIQTVTAISYVNMDIILISQFVYYKLKNQKMMKGCRSIGQASDAIQPSVLLVTVTIGAVPVEGVLLHCSLSGAIDTVHGSKRLKNFCITWILMCITLCGVLPCQLLIRKQDHSSAMERSNNSLDMIEMSGFVCGYISCVFYLGSRFPQLYKNFQRKSTEGTSYLLFALAMLGNCTYGLSLVLKMPAAGSVRALFFLHHLPWLLGSFGVLFLDVFVSFSCLLELCQVTLQFLLYGQHKERPHALVALEVEPLLVGEEDT
ncbi:hypothetical protein CIB84_006785 [Bambusicola thoracicus]|uniref:PQ-loop repeat-containing protein 2 n=1 Tax=Bambusicola thoracicus TaxID=9083 RepID=A0A2P4SZD1_BAMTH|nr:hypothetical protein CIB84_006785 [Bambusicola thoracicus]